MVMYLGRVVEIGQKRRIFAMPHHPSAKALLSVAPEPDPDAASRRIILAGDVPSPTRCPPAAASTRAARSRRKSARMDALLCQFTSSYPVRSWCGTFLIPVMFNAVPDA